MNKSDETCHFRIEAKQYVAQRPEPGAYGVRLSSGHLTLDRSHRACIPSSRQGQCVDHQSTLTPVGPSKLSGGRIERDRPRRMPPSVVGWGFQAEGGYCAVSAVIPISMVWIRTRHQSSPGQSKNSSQYIDCGAVLENEKGTNARKGHGTDAARLQ
ncbi:hypothetical protein PG994_013390 [Apiospora phragmitis]|uniref:Uncharacterized protein n=1 Tax=Apiospora phragmitis TaxID=2905665 RepID=A0ABR1T900_9PEZI